MSCSMETMEEIGKRITGLRVQRGLTQEALAEELNVSRQVVAKWETGIRDIKNSHTIEIANFFSVTCDYVLRGVPAEQVDIFRQTGLTPYSVALLNKSHNTNARQVVAFVNTLLEHEGIGDFVNEFNSYMAHLALDRDRTDFYTDVEELIRYARFTFTEEIIKLCENLERRFSNGKKKR